MAHAIELRNHIYSFQQCILQHDKNTAKQDISSLLFARYFVKDASRLLRETNDITVTSILEGKIHDMQEPVDLRESTCDQINNHTQLIRAAKSKAARITVSSILHWIVSKLGIKTVR